MEYVSGRGVGVRVEGGERGREGKVRAPERDTQVVPGDGCGAVDDLKVLATTAVPATDRPPRRSREADNQGSPSC